ncbi:MAG TPA: putative toxin-antitoxin system toxin component, PIN family, partial [Candidatus Saccharimonadales bacterium]|nr:putative toxin-antitoxin system toxin component, PIN family [Candidatus Saccharimonadales bacterium]
MQSAVIDTGVFVAGVFWRHEPYLCLKAWLRGILLPVMSEEILREYEAVLERVKREQRFQTDIGSWLDALRSSASWVTPIPLGRKVCRDSKDDKFIAAALACDARTVIARDHDLTVLQKPFGIVMQTPRAWLATLTRSQRRILD